MITAAQKRFLATNNLCYRGTITIVLGLNSYNSLLFSVRAPLQSVKHTAVKVFHLKHTSSHLTPLFKTLQWFSITLEGNPAPYSWFTRLCVIWALPPPQSHQQPLSHTLDAPVHSCAFRLRDGIYKWITARPCIKIEL